MCHALVIEDEWLVAEYVEQIARDAGATSVDQATTQQDAIAAALANPPAIILSDVKLAEGTGPLAVVEIMATLGSIPTIFITGTPEACEPCDHAHAIISKPVDPNALKTAFRQAAPI